jgi:ADP-heptose:LPS heptosyltransferase
VALGRRPRLVVLRALGLGDLLTAVPALRALGRAYPDHERVLAAPAALEPLVAAIDEGLRLVPAGEIEPLSARAHGPETAVNLHGRGPESHRLLLAARPGRCLWFEHADVPESHGAPAWRAGEHEVERWCRMLAEHGVPANTADLDIDPPEGEPPGAALGATLIHPGAASVARRWPAERFGALARAERERGAHVVVTGGPDEVELAAFVVWRAGLEPEANLAGRTDLVGLARCVGAAARVVCGDTGVAHLATALGTPSVVLFGPSSPTEWGPPAERTIHRSVWAGRRGDPHAPVPDPGLLDIGVERVQAALAELPARAYA